MGGMLTIVVDSVVRRSDRKGLIEGTQGPPVGLVQFPETQIVEYLASRWSHRDLG